MKTYYAISSINDLYLMHHGIKGQKWGVRRYQDENGHYTSEGKIRRQVLTASNNVGKRLTTNAQPFVAEPIDIFKVQARGSLSRYEAEKCAKLANDIFKTAQKHEPKITGDVIDAISKVNAKMYGLDHRMKQPTSLAAKIGSDAKSDGVSFKQASNDIHDVIRYTAVSDPSNFSQTYNSVKKQLEANGYSEIQCKNYFKRFNDGKVSHKAVQSVYSTPDGVSFELQFQTPESQAVKELKIPLYEEARKISTSEARRQQLSKQMRILGDNIEDPDEVFDILEHDEIHSDKAFDTRTYLSHHGIKGQKWGVRRYQNPDGSLTDEGRERYSTSKIPNAKKLNNYNGPAYFISEKKLNSSILNPRIPDNYFTKNGYEDSNTPRVSFAPSVDKCLAGLSQNVEGKEYYVYRPKDILKQSVYKPNSKAVPDSDITDELWITNPVEIEPVGKIKVTGNKGQEGKKFSYGDKQAELYDDWTYKTDKTFDYNENLRTNEVINNMVRNMSKEDRKRLLDDEYNNDYISPEETKKLVKRMIETDGDIPVAFCDIYDGSDSWKYMTVGTKNDPKYRQKGYATKCAQAGKQWLDDNWDSFSQDTVYWSARSDNVASSKIAEKIGFTKESSNDGWEIYSYKGPNN